MAAAWLHCLWEIIDNSVDEALHGTCTEIEVILHADHSAEVHRQRPRHPGRHRAEDRAERRRAGDDQAARGRQVRRRLLHRVRRPARRRRLRGQRAVRPARRRTSTGAGYEWAASFRRGVPGEFAGDGPDAAVHAGLRPAQGPQGGQDADRHQDPGSGRTGRSSCPAPSGRSSSSIQRARQTAYLVPGLSISVTDERPPALALVRPADDDADAGRSGPQDRRVPLRRRDQRVLRAPERRRRRSPTCIRLTGAGQFTETVPVLDEPGPPDAHRGRARARGRRRAALGHRLRHRHPVVRQRDRHAQGRHARHRLRAGPGQDAQRAAAGRQAAARPATSRSSRKTCSRA